VFVVTLLLRELIELGDTERLASMPVGKANEADEVRVSGLEACCWRDFGAEPLRTSLKI